MTLGLGVALYKHLYIITVIAKMSKSVQTVNLSENEIFWSFDQLFGIYIRQKDISC